jgi:transposase
MLSRSVSIDKHGELISNKAISPSKLKELLAKTVPSIVAMEGCGACHYWARLAQRHGHDVRVISPKKVKGFLQGHKTDANDALAIAIPHQRLVSFGVVNPRPVFHVQHSFSSK